MKYPNGFMIALALLLLAIACILRQHITIGKLQHTVATQKLILSVPAEDSLKFGCRHCGWEHNLSVRDTIPKIEIPNLNIK